MPVAGIDIGTTRTRLVVYDDSLEPEKTITLPSPLESRGRAAWHDPHRLRSTIEDLLARAEGWGARRPGISLYRASVSAWKPGGDPLDRIILWMDEEARARALESLPLLGRLLRRVPPYKSILSLHSPLPTIAYLSRLHRAPRTWTIEALVLEWLGAGYTSDEASAAVSALYHPANMREIPLARRAAGLPRWHEAPRLSGNILEEGRASGIIPDQQAASLGLGCARPGCLKISLGTGAFADLALEKPMLLPGRGTIPVILYSEGGRRLHAAEAMVPGLGHRVEQHAKTLGGFQPLHRLGPDDCKNPAPPDSPLRARPGSLDPCQLVTGAVLEVAEAVHRLPRRATMAWITGGLARVPLVRLLLALLLPLPRGSRVMYYPGEASARGAAALALYAGGRASSPIPDPPEATMLPGPSDPGLAKEIVSAWRSRDRGRLEGLLGVLLGEAWRALRG